MAQFGTVFCDQFSIARFEDGAWQAPQLTALEPLSMHPAAHVFHYASTCFEGFKAYRWEDGSVQVFRSGSLGWSARPSQRWCVTTSGGRGWRKQRSPRPEEEQEQEGEEADVSVLPQDDDPESVRCLHQAGAVIGYPVVPPRAPSGYGTPMRPSKQSVLRLEPLAEGGNPIRAEYGLRHADEYVGSQDPGGPPGDHAGRNEEHEVDGPESTTESDQVENPKAEQHECTGPRGLA